MEKFNRIIVAIIITSFTITATIVAYKNITYVANKNNSDISVTIDSDDKYKGAINDYTYKITYDNQTVKMFENRGYLKNLQKIPNSPIFFNISAGKGYKAIIKKITIKNDNLEILVQEEKSESSNIEVAEVEFLKNNTTPNFKTVIIKNGEEEYEEYVEYHIGDKGTLNNTNIQYNIQGRVDNPSLDLTKKGYYLVESPAEKRNEYIISIGNYFGGCHGLGIENMSYKNNTLKVIVSDDVEMQLCTDPGPNINDYKGINIYLVLDIITKDDYNIEVFNRTPDGNLEELTLLDSVEIK